MNQHKTWGSKAQQIYFGTYKRHLRQYLVACENFLTNIKTNKKNQQIFKCKNMIGELEL